MKFRNPWIDPRIIRVRPDDIQTYLVRHGWTPSSKATNPHLTRYEISSNDDAPTLFVPVEMDGGPGLQWTIELVEDLARFEERWAVDVLNDILGQASDNGLPRSAGPSRDAVRSDS